MAVWDFPTSLEVAGTEYRVRRGGDYRLVLDVMEVLADDTITDEERGLVSLSVFFEGYLPEEMGAEANREAVRRMMWFINCGRDSRQGRQPRVMDWDQDFHLLVAPLNHIIGCEIRAAEYLHWWTLLAAYLEVGECYFQQVVSIRMKKAKGKRLDKADQEFYQRHRSDIDLRCEMTQEEEDLLSEWLPRRGWRMADGIIAGALTFSTAIDNSDLEKGLEDAQKKVEGLKQKIESSEGKRSALEQQMDEARKQIEAASEATEALRSRLEWLRSIDISDMRWSNARMEIRTLAAELEKAEEELKLAEPLEKLEQQWQDLDDEVKGYESSLADAEAEQSQLAQTVGSGYYQAGVRVREAFSGMSEGVERFTRRIGQMVQQALVFSVFTQALNTLKKGIGEALQQNMQFSATWEHLSATMQGFANGIADAIAPALVQVVDGVTACIVTLARAIDTVFKTGLVAAIDSARKTAEESWRQTDESKKAQKEADKNAKVSAKQQERYQKQLESYRKRQEQAAKRLSGAQEKAAEKEAAAAQKYPDALEDAAERQAEAEESMQKRIARAEEKAQEHYEKAIESAEKRRAKAEETAAERTASAQAAYEKKVATAQPRVFAGQARFAAGLLCFAKEYGLRLDGAIPKGVTFSLAFHTRVLD